MDKLTIVNLKIATHIGVYPWEQKILQTLLLTFSFTLDYAICQDDINQTLDYDKLCQAVHEFARIRSFKLIESFAHELANYLKEEFKLAEIELTVLKPYALKGAEGVQIKVLR